jgi:hypothetical protein
LSLQKFQGETVKEFWAWCYRIARNKLNDQFRKQYADRLQPTPPEEMARMMDISAQHSPISMTASRAALPASVVSSKPFKFAASPYEYKVTALRECPTPDAMQHCETPDKAADYWRLHIATPRARLEWKRFSRFCHVGDSAAVPKPRRQRSWTSGHHAFTATLALTLRALSGRAERKVLRNHQFRIISLSDASPRNTNHH